MRGREPLLIQGEKDQADKTANTEFRQKLVQHVRGTARGPMRLERREHRKLVRNEAREGSGGGIDCIRRVSFVFLIEWLL